MGLGFTANNAFLASLIGNLFMIVACPFAGRLGDRYAVERMMRLAILTLGVVPLVALWILHQVPTLPVLVVVHIVLCLAVSFYAGIIASALSWMFPVAVRSTGMSFAYNIAAIFFAGFTPAIMTWAIGFTPLATGMYVTLSAIVAFVTLPFMVRLINQQPDGVEYLRVKSEAR